MTRQKAVNKLGRVCLSIGSVLLSGALYIRAEAATVTVSSTNDSGPGSLRQAIAGTAAGDLLGFAPSVTGPIHLVSVGQRGPALVIDKNLTIQGPGARVLAVDSGGQSTIVYISSGTVSISGLTLANGHADTNV